MRDAEQPETLQDPWLEMWCQATRWQRAVDRALARYGIGHGQYLILRVINELENEYSDAVMQRTICEMTQLEAPSVCYAVRALDRKCLISRGPDAFDVRICRIRVTPEGRSLLAETSPVVDAVAAAFARSAKDCRA